MRAIRIFWYVKNSKKKSQKKTIFCQNLAIFFTRSVESFFLILLEHTQSLIMLIMFEWLQIISVYIEQSSKHLLPTKIVHKAQEKIK